MICHAPSAAGTEVPFAFEADFFGKIQCHSDCGDQRFRVTEVRALMEVNTFQWKVVSSAKSRGFHDLCARHAEFAVVLPGLRVGVMGCNRDTGQEAKPKVYVTLREWRLFHHDRRVSLVAEEVLTCTCARCKWRFAQDDMEA